MGDYESLSTNELIAVMCKAMCKRCRIWRIKGGHLDIWGDGKAKVKHGASRHNKLGVVLDL